MDYSLRYRVIFSKDHYAYKSSDKGVYETSIGAITKDPGSWSGVDVICNFMNYQIFGDSYGYSFDAPTEDQINQWWKEGVRKFVLWDNFDDKRVKTKLYADFFPVLCG